MQSKICTSLLAYLVYLQFVFNWLMVSLKYHFNPQPDKQKGRLKKKKKKNKRKKKKIWYLSWHGFPIQHCKKVCFNNTRLASHSGSRFAIGGIRAVTNSKDVVIFFMSHGDLIHINKASLIRDGTS